MLCHLHRSNINFVSWCPYRYEVLYAPQPPAAFCQFQTSVELTLQHQLADTNDLVMHHAERLKAEGTTAAACMEQVQEIEHCIIIFLHENGEQGSLSLAGIITSALCTLCRFNTFIHFHSISLKWQYFWSHYIATSVRAKSKLISIQACVLLTYWFIKTKCLSFL